ncbi:MAG: iron-containing redox enzyme family protein [Acidimicrobiales bacterium]
MKKESTASPVASVDVEAVISSAIGSRRLLSHPFYQRWLDGSLQAGELTAYAAQYRYFEAQLPGFLAKVLEELPPGPAHDLVEANLTDELSVPAPHLALFDAFSAAVGAEAELPTPATQALVSCYARWADAPSAAAVGALAAYEVQAAEVAASKAAGLRDRYGLDAAATEFWDVHATADLDHAKWVVEALVDLVGEAEGAVAMAAAADDAARAWWAFLDEREAARPVAA